MDKLEKLIKFFKANAVAALLLIGIGVQIGLFLAKIGPLENDVKELKNLSAIVTSLNTTVALLDNTVKRLDATVGNLASKEDLRRIDDRLRDLELSLIKVGLAGRPKLSMLQEALTQIPSLKVNDPLNRKTFYIVPEDQAKSNELLERWSRKSPTDRQKIAPEYLSLFKPETRIWEVPPDSDVAYLYTYRQIPPAVLDSFKGVLSSPLAVLVPFGPTTVVPSR